MKSEDPTQPRTMRQRFMEWLFKHTDNETEQQWEDRQW